MALVMRYIAGGRYELGAAAPTDAGRLLGAGMTLAVGTAVVPLLFGAAPRAVSLSAGEGGLDRALGVALAEILPWRARPSGCWRARWTWAPSST